MLVVMLEVWWLGIWIYLYFFVCRGYDVPGWEPELFVGNVRLTVWKKEYGAENESFWG